MYAYTSMSSVGIHGLKLNTSGGLVHQGKYNDKAS